MPSVLLVSTYDMGRQPFGLASPAAWLIDAGADVVCVDLAKERLLDDVVRRSDVVAFFLPMHTATRLALPVIDRVRALNPGARLAAYGLYAPLNDALLRARGSHGGPRRRVRGRSGAGVHGRAERRGHADDCRRFSDDGRHRCARGIERRAEIPRLHFRVPVRTGLLPLTRYATLQVGRRAPDRRVHRSEPRLQASLPALSDRPGLRRAVSRRARPTSCSPTSGRRSPPARATSRSAIPISSTASGTPRRSSRASRASFRA